MTAIDSDAPKYSGFPHCSVTVMRVTRRFIFPIAHHALLFVNSIAHAHIAAVLTDSHPVEWKQMYATQHSRKFDIGFRFVDHVILIVLTNEVHWYWHTSSNSLQESVSEQTKACYHQLSQQVAMAIKHEESRCCHFCKQRKIMDRIIEERAVMLHDSGNIPSLNIDGMLAVFCIIGVTCVFNYWIIKWCLYRLWWQVLLSIWPS